MSISEKNESVNTGRLEKKLKKIIFESKSRFCYRLRNEEYWQCASWKCIKAFYKVKKQPVMMKTTSSKQTVL